MDWLEDARRIIEWENQREANKEASRRAHLSVSSLDDLPSSYDGIKEVFFRTNYSGPSLESILPEILDRATDLVALYISGEKIKWETICSCDLSHLQSLSINIDGEITSERLTAPNLKSLRIVSGIRLLPIELLIHPTPHIDYSGMSMLESLDLCYFQQIDPTDFQNVSTLKRLRIAYSEIRNLDWLQNATYSLDSLLIDGCLDDCSGVVFQPNLKRLYLCHNYISDVSPIEKLQNLTELNLQHEHITSEGNLRNMGIEKLILTRDDYEQEQLQRKVKELVRWPAMRYREQNKQLNKIEELPNLQRRRLLRDTEGSFEERMRRLVRIGFKNEVRCIYERDTLSGISISKEEYIKRYIEEAIRYCPFLAKMNEPKKPSV